jgi:drug/metabolite transporter (DMT)-like permease
VRTAAALALVFNALVWGLSWWPFRRLDEAGLHPLWSTALIYGVCVVAMTLARPGAWGGMRHGVLWAIAAGSGLTNACFNWGVATGDVVRVTLLFYLMPLWAVVFARVILHEPITRASLLRVVLALAGAAIVLGVGPDRLPLPSSLPDVLGLVGGAAFAFNNVMLRHARHRDAASRTLAMFLGGVVLSLSAALALGAAGLVTGPRLDAPHVPGLVVVGFAFLLANLALQFGAARLPANATAVIMLSEVAFAAVSAWLLGAAQADLRVAAGGALIVVAALLAALDRTHGGRDPAHGVGPPGSS